MKLNPQRRAIATVILFGAIIAGLCAGLIWPLISAIKAMHHDTNGLRVFLEKRYEQSLTMRAMLGRIQEVSTELAQHPDYLFRKGEELELITALEKAAVASRAEYRIVQSNLDVADRKENTLTLLASGAYSDVLAFVAAVENLPYFIVIERLAFGAAGQQTDGGAPGAVEATITFSLYVNQ